MRYWTESEREIMREMYPEHYTADIAKKLNRTERSIYSAAKALGLKKSESFKEKERIRKAALLNESGAKHRFKKGQVAYNKGKKLSSDAYERVRHTFFKKGNIPHNVLEVGTEVIRTDRQGRPHRFVKVAGMRKLVPKHIHIWECANGKVEKGYNVIFKDGNTMNCDLSNLRCISDAELMLMNTIHRYPKELKEVIKLTNKLKRTINAKEQN